MLWLAPLLLALGLLASLVPQVTYATASSGEPAGEVLFAWPGWGVQQDLGPLSGTVGTFQISLSAEPGGDDLTVRATLIDATTREVVRAWIIEVTPSYTPVFRTLAFPGYVVPQDQRLLLQLRVADFEHNYAIFGLASPHPQFANLMLNGVADAGSGPLAFAQMETGSGLRAAIAGSPAERIRLVLALGLGVLTFLTYPRAASALIGTGVVAWRLASQPVLWARRVGGSRAVPNAGSGATTSGGFLSVPWYPWPIAAAPILHFLTANRLLFAVGEVLFPLAVALVVVTGSVVSLRLILKDWHRAAAIATAGTVVVFAYGHVENALGRRIDDRVMFSAATVLLAITVVAALRANIALARGAPFFNLIAFVLLAFPVTSLANAARHDLRRTSSAETTAMGDLTAHLFPAMPLPANDKRPDIYYIIFDEYARHDMLVDFDNTDFLRELQRRGFYVATEATSNYMFSQHSIASLLNMSYLDSVASRTPNDIFDVTRLGRHHAAGAILKELGYTYVHLSSGHTVTDHSPLADVYVNFAPLGVLIGDEEDEFRSVITTEYLLVGRFVRELIQTTALRPLLGHHFAPGSYALYPWWHPNRTLQMFDYLTSPIDVDGPKFVLAHFVKPHPPATFDRHGNTVPGRSSDDAFRDDHDPSVSSAYIGQLIFLNSQILKMIDGIQQNHGEDPIIVISGDHGRNLWGWGSPHAILAAFHLPHGGNSVFNPSISSVNHFRSIFNFYFGFGLDILENRWFQHGSSGVEFREIRAENVT